MTLTMITPFYAAIIGLFMIFLAWRVVHFRMEHQVGLGDGGQKDLMRAIRVHANLVEYAPTALILLFLVESLGFNRGIVHGLGAFLVIARFLHAYGLGQSAGISVGRKWGTKLTWGMIVASALLCLIGSFGLTF